MKKSFLLICIVLLLSSCGTKLNPEWYPLGSGKDTVYVLGNGKFNLGKTSSGIHLSMYNDEGYSGVLLAKVSGYKKKNGKLYVSSEEGYCVAYEDTNTAKVLIIVEEQYYSNLVGEDEAIKYLSNFEEFEEEEQKILKQLENNANKK